MILKTKIKSGNIFKTIIISFYIVILISIGAFVLGIVIPNLKLPLYASLLFSMLFTILGVLGGSYLSVISDLSTQVYKNFDEVKNDVADNKINSPEEFSKVLSDFLIKTFNYVFFDVKYCIFKLENSNYYYSNECIHDQLSNELVSFEEYSKNYSGVKFISVVNIEDIKHYCYGVPIWFGKDYLGYFAVLTRQKLNSFFKNYLADFEDDYIDDQLKIVIDKKLLIEQKKMFREIDVYSDKITKDEYKSVTEYSKDILDYFMNKLNCYAGIIKLEVIPNPITKFRTKENESLELVDYYSNQPLPNEQKYFRIPNFGNPVIFQIPIGIEKPYGVIYLFSLESNLFRYYNYIIDGVEDIKLDNDFENLMKQYRN